VPLVRSTVAAAFSLELTAVSVSAEAVHGGVDDEDDIAATAAVAAVGAAACHKLLTVEADEAVSTVTRPHVYLCAINHFNASDRGDS
jgi:hypothetical protein